MANGQQSENHPSILTCVAKRRDRLLDDLAGRRLRKEKNPTAKGRSDATIVASGRFHHDCVRAVDMPCSLVDSDLGGNHIRNGYFV